jgi:aminoglycoside/choline kinase family phosphotransferase
MSPPTSAHDLARALALARRALGPAATLTEISGDASTRRFYRAAAGGATAIVMVHDGPLSPDAPQFSNHRILETIGAPVPRLIDADREAGLVLVEDLGDLTLQRHLAAAGAGAAPALYRQACDLIALFQGRAPAAIRPDDFAARNALDRERFFFELDHFHRHYILGLRRLTPTPSEETLLRRFYEDLAGDCDRLPRVYCHRDFQSRNLMVVGNGLRIVDFQDARMGPYTYDAASLLRDSSLDLDPDLVREMLDRLAGSIAAALGIGPEEFERDFDLMGLQRNLKDLGTFGYMATQRARGDYLAYVPRTIAAIQRTAARDPRWHAIYPWLHRFALDGVR